MPTPGVKRVLVTRCPYSEPVPALLAALPALAVLGVAVYNYWLPRAGGYETFHAKVVLSDEHAAYIGSANMTQASLSLSMELGTFLKGSSVKTLASVLNAILDIAPKLG